MKGFNFISLLLLSLALVLIQGQSLSCGSGESSSCEKDCCFFTGVCLEKKECRSHLMQLVSKVSGDPLYSHDGNQHHEETDQDTK